MEINYDYAPEADSSSFVEIKRKKTKQNKNKVSLDQEHLYNICLPWDFFFFLFVSLKKFF